MRAARCRNLRRVARLGVERAGGFSLLELVFTIAILTSVGLATTLVLVPVSRQSRIVRETQAANSAAQRVMERIQATPFKDILELYPPSMERPIPELHDGKVTITYDDPEGDPLVVHAEVAWQSPDLGSMSRTFTTSRTE